MRLLFMRLYSFCARQNMPVPLKGLHFKALGASRPLFFEQPPELRQGLGFRV